MARSPCSAPPHPVLVHRPAIALPASFTSSSGPDALRFASLAVTSSRVDFHLQDRAHAGRTMKQAPDGAPVFNDISITCVFDRPYLRLSAPLMISISSVVIEAWRARL